MKHWPLARKLTLWSALVVGVALMLCMTGVIWFTYHDEIEELDNDLAAESEELFFDLKKFGNGDIHNLSAITEDMIPPALNGRWLEIHDQGGRLLFASKNLAGTTLTGSRRDPLTIAMGDRSVRTGSYSRGDLKLHLGGDLAEINDLIHKLTIAFLVGLPLVVAVVGFGCRWIALHALAPIRAVTRAAERITAERLDQRLEVPPTRDEIAALSTVLNQMFDRLDASFRQTVRFSADASHELRTPLTIMRSGLEDLLRLPNLEPATEETLHDLIEETRRLTAISEDLLLLSRADSGRLNLDFTDADLLELIANCAEDIHILAEPQEITIETTLPPAARVRADSDRLTRVLLNVFENAVKFNRPGGTIRIDLTRDATTWDLSVANTGVGIPPSHAEHLFERFYRGQPPAGARGHGLGLSIARELARAHGGELSLAHSNEQSTEFRLRLPAP